MAARGVEGGRSTLRADQHVGLRHAVARPAGRARRIGRTAEGAYRRVAGNPTHAQSPGALAVVRAALAKPLRSPSGAACGGEQAEHQGTPTKHRRTVACPLKDRNLLVSIGGLSRFDAI